jgi:hypothetical protein
MIHFTIYAPAGSLTTVPVGRVPGGFRLQIAYSEDIKFQGQASDGRPIEGKVLAGMDWVLLRDDGVAVFDAQITFQASIPNPGGVPSYHIFDGDLSGQVNVKSPAAGSTWPINTVADWQKLNGTAAARLPIQFETSNKPPTGASTAIQTAGDNWEMFHDLAISQFLASGTITIMSGALESAELQVASVDDHIEAAVRQQAMARPTISGIPPRTMGSVRHDVIVGLLLSATETKWMAIRGVLPLVGKHLKKVISEHCPAANDALAALVQNPKLSWVEAEKLIRRITSFVEQLDAAE